MEMTSPGIFKSIRNIVSWYGRLVPCAIRHPNHRCIVTTAILRAEPPKKKRRIDPAVFRVRVERKIKKVEREISKLEAEPRQLIPILEYEYTNSDLRDLNARPQHKMEDFQLTPGMVRAAQRLWNLYRQEEAAMENRSIRRIVRAQEKALDELKVLDKQLYDNTVSVDETILIPFRSSQMRTETAPNPDYRPPDGYVKDITKEWVM